MKSAQHRIVYKLIRLISAAGLLYCITAMTVLAQVPDFKRWQHMRTVKQ